MQKSNTARIVWQVYCKNLQLAYILSWSYFFIIPIEMCGSLVSMRILVFLWTNYFSVAGNARPDLGSILAIIPLRKAL
jgi:hypothetical protein